MFGWKVYCGGKNFDGPDINGNYIGRCPGNSHASGCGATYIENGKIPADFRQCIY